jgi:hypothetical protein
MEEQCVLNSYGWEQVAFTCDYGTFWFLQDIYTEFVLVA